MAIVWPKPVDRPYIIKLETVVDGCVFCFPFYPLIRSKFVISIALFIFQNPDTDSDSEAEEENLEELETMLKEHDPEYQKYVRLLILISP